MRSDRCVAVGFAELEANAMITTVLVDHWKVKTQNHVPEAFTNLQM